MRHHLNPNLLRALAAAFGLLATATSAKAQINPDVVIHALEHVCIPAAAGGIEGVRASANAHGYTSGGGAFGIVQPTTSLLRSEGTTQVRIPQFAPGKGCGFNVIDLGDGTSPRPDLSAALARWAARQSPPFVQIGNNYERLMPDGQRMSAWQRTTPRGMEILNAEYDPAALPETNAARFTVAYSAPEGAGPSRPLPPPARPVAPPPRPIAAPAGPRGQAEQAGYTPRILTDLDTGIAMYGGPIPTRRPATPVVAWMWVFLRSPGVLGETAQAFRMRLDCAAWTTQILGVELYNDAGFTDVQDAPQAASRPPEGSTGAYMLGSACDPGFHAGRHAFVDWRAARSGATDYFRTRPPTAVASAPAPTAPVMTPSRAQAVRGPYRLVEATSTYVRIIAGPRPSMRPTAPVDRWIHVVFNRPLSTSAGPQDASAQLTRFDCAGRTVQALETEAFFAGRKTGEDRQPQAVMPATAGVSVQRELAAACDPAAPLSGVYSDLATARFSARNMLDAGRTWP